jgi:hypothetical protein
MTVEERKRVNAEMERQDSETKRVNKEVSARCGWIALTHAASAVQVKRMDGENRRIASENARIGSEMARVKEEVQCEFCLQRVDES